MKITLESTPVIVEVDDGVMARRWTGATDTGIPVVAYVVAVSPQTHDEAALARFTAELEVLESVAEIEPPRSCSYDAEDGPELGPCCVCETTTAVRYLIMLDRRCAIPGHGWGCLVCGLPSDGAYAVLCDDCLPKWRRDQSILTIASHGYPAGEGRIPIAELPAAPFEHDPSKHEGSIR
jgi:hypothetical protein